MTYEQVKNATLKLLNQFTMAGVPVAGSYNNQQDYLNRIPTLVNDALMEISTTAKKITVLQNLRSLPREDLGKQVRYELPGDFYQLVSGSVVTTQEGKVLHTNQYSTQTSKYLLVPKEEAGDYTVAYYRYPQLLPETPAADDELDNDPETHFAIPYYVAAMLVIHDDAFLYASFYNKYEDKLAKMGPGLTAEIDATQDVYAFFG